MSLSDFLFEGKPPPAVTTYGTSAANLPPWMSDYTQGLIARANAVAAEPYQPYSGPRIAGFTGDQTQAQQLVRGNVGNWAPGLAQAEGAFTNVVNADIPGAAAPYMIQAGKTLPGNVQQYMDPYVGSVINRAELEANRNFQENIMPSLMGKFTSAGQYGSSANQREADIAARNLTEGLQSQSQAALSQAYQQAAGEFQADQARQAGLAATAGDLATREAAAQLQGGQGLETAALSRQGAGLKDTAALSASGAEQQQQQQKNLDLAYQDFLAQRNYPRTNVDWMSSVIRGVPAPVSTSTTATAPLTKDYQPTGLAQVGALLSAGKGIYDIFNPPPAGSKRGGRIRAPVARRHGGYMVRHAFA